MSAFNAYIRATRFASRTALKHKRKGMLALGAYGGYAAFPSRGKPMFTIEEENRVNPPYGRPPAPTMDKLAKAYDGSKHPRSAIGRFAAKAGAAVHDAVYGSENKDEKDKPSFLRTSTLLGALEGYKAVEPVGAIALTGAAAHAVNRARFGDKAEGKGSHARNAVANHLRSASEKRTAMVAMAHAERAQAEKGGLDGALAARRELRRHTAHMEALVADAEHRISLAGVTKLHSSRYIPVAAAAAALGAVSAHRRSAERDGHDVSTGTHIAATLGDGLRVAGEAGVASTLPSVLVNEGKRLAGYAGKKSPQILASASRHTGKAGAMLGTLAAASGIRTLLREQRDRNARA